MAAPTPYKQAAAAAKDDNNETEVAEVLRRVSRAEIDRNRHISRIRDCYKYTMPWRHLDNQTQPTDQLDEIFDALPATVLEDFAADMGNTFTTQNSPWVEIKPAEALDSAQSRQIEGPLEEYQRVLFAEMARSNLYQALQESYMDLGIGTMALLIQDIGADKPLHCQSIPAPDLLIDRGPYGFVSGIGRKWSGLRAEDVPVLWPSAKPLEPHLTTKGGECAEVEAIDWCWRDWKDKSDEVWKYRVIVGNKIILSETYTGEGAHPFIVARWSRDSTTAWGMGPTYRVLPEIKTLNHINFTSLKLYDRQVDPAFSYEDDGVVNLDHGLNPGMGVPRAVGSNAPEVIESKSRMDVHVFQLDERRGAIKRAHYQDRPEQKGKTPPTAHQWADEAAERARRMGSPATNLVIELQYPIIRRFAYLLGKRGKLPKVQLNSQDISLVPISPLLRAQEQEKVLRMDRFVEMLSVRFGPEMTNAIVKQFEYAEDLANALGVSTKLLRTETEIAQAVQQFAGMQGGGAAPAAGAPPA